MRLRLREMRLHLRENDAAQHAGYRSKHIYIYVQVVTGRVKKVEAFGVFIAVADSLLQGLAHVSELSDDFTKDPAATFAPGQAVRAVVLRKDETQARLSLGLKASYFIGDGDGDGSGEDGAAGAQLLEADGAGGEKGAAAAGDDDEMDLEDAMAAAFEESDSDGGSDEDGGGGGSSADEAGDDSEEEATQRVLQAAREEAAAGGGGDEGDAAAMEAEVADAVAAAQDSSSDEDAAADARTAGGAAQAGPQAAGAHSGARRTAGLPQASSTGPAAFGCASLRGCSPECCLSPNMFAAVCARRRFRLPTVVAMQVGRANLGRRC